MVIFQKEETKRQKSETTQKTEGSMIEEREKQDKKEDKMFHILSHKNTIFDGCCTMIPFQSIIYIEYKTQIM